MKKNIVLFDMDGTLTEPRGNFDTELLISLRQLSKKSEIGILTGSDLKYINTQLLKLLRFSEVRYSLHLLPCNGTKYYKPPIYSNDEFELVHENDMRKELGDTCLRDIFRVLSQAQEAACYSSIPLTGHFIDYRGSMINWCPIGRNANKEQRKEFVAYDKQEDFRNQLIKKLSTKMSLKCPNKVDIKLGGETSFDIYPIGWDKTYGLRHFADYNCWFVGDKCFPGGNDYEVYQRLLPEGKAFSTSSTTETGAIIRNHILPKLQES